LIPISCSTRCFPQETIDRALARIAWAGFRAAEVACGPDDVPLPETLGQRLETEGLELVAVDAGPVAASTPEGALEAAARVGRCAVLAHELGAPLAVLTAPRPDAGSLEHLAYGLAKLLDALVEVPVDLALRHARGTLVESPAAFLGLFELVGSPRLTLALDPAEAVLAGWAPEAALAELTGECDRPGRGSADRHDRRPPPARVAHVYFTDAAGGRRVVPGTGDLDWVALAGRLAAYAYRGAVSVLLDVEDPLHVESDAKEACAYAEEVFADVL
jgi:sugar phosphate isomerase/epimerase